MAFLLLILDERIREIWLRPSDLALVRYGWTNASTLLPATDLFFLGKTGFGMTLRRALVVLMFISVVVSTIFAVLGRLQESHREKNPSRSRLRRLVWLALLVIPAGTAIASPHYRYRVEENILVNNLFSAFRRDPAARSVDRALTDRFDQRPVTLTEALSNPRRLLASVAPFDNLVIVILESVRWQGLGLDTEVSAMPVLSALGQQGIFARSRVSIPHSTKSDYEIFTGRRGYPDIEAREGEATFYPSVIREVAVRKNARTLVVSSMFLTFENLLGLLRGAGFEEIYETRNLQKRGGRTRSVGSSFGSGDEELYSVSTEMLLEGRKPFVALLLPTAAHYPYDYPGKRSADSGKRDYLNSIAHSNRLLGEMIERFEKVGLTNSTLFVFVGDHGELFGEHGLSAHNSSVYDVEVTTPLVFWSADGRLRQSKILSARHLDIAPTIADLMGVTDSVVPVEGRSLLRDDEQVAYLSAFFDNVQLGMVQGMQKDIYSPSDGHAYRYDLATDPTESRGSLLQGDERQRSIDRLTVFRAYYRNWRSDATTVSSGASVGATHP